VPRAIQEEIDGAKNYYDVNRACVYCAVIGREMGAQSRIVAESERFIVFCPYASRFPYETWILPKQHAPCFEYRSEEDYTDLARSLRETLVRLDRRIENPPLNYFIHSNPFGEAANAYYHWHIEILPKLSQVGGFEWGSGAYINSVAPEDAARHLREVTF
jgi:UDPglucose--hexose-1-phosphate uridylyltransferase